MRARFARILLGGAAAVLSATLSATTALAASSWTVTPGGPYRGSGTLMLEDGSTGSIFSCDSSIAGKFRKGTGPGTHIGSITSLGLSKCTGPLGLTFTATAGGLPWFLNAASYKSGTTTGKVTGIHLSFSGAGCSAVVDGTPGSKDNGKVTFTYTNSTHKLTMGTPDNLHAYSVSGCEGLLNSGDSMNMSATYTITPPQTITGP